MNEQISGQCIIFSNDVPNIFFNINIGAITLTSLFLYFCLFSLCNKYISFEEQYVYLNFLNLTKTNLCGAFVLLFSVFMNIVSMVKFGQLMTNFEFHSLLC